MWNRRRIPHQQKKCEAGTICVQLYTSCTATTRINPSGYKCRINPVIYLIAFYKGKKGMWIQLDLNWVGPVLSWKKYLIFSKNLWPGRNRGIGEKGNFHTFFVKLCSQGVLKYFLNKKPSQIILEKKFFLKSTFINCPRKNIFF